MGDLSIFAMRLKQKRKEKDWTQDNLSERAGISVQAVSAYEKAEKGGKGKNPTLDSAIKIADALDVSLDWLCGREKNTDVISAKTLGDIARILIYMCDLKDVQLCHITGTRRVKVGQWDEYPEFDDIEFDDPAVAFSDGDIKKFLIEWEKIRKLRASNTIDDELYQLWIDKHLSTLDGIICKRPFDDFSVEIEEELGDLPF